MILSFIFEIEPQYRKCITPYKLRFTSSINNQTSTLITNFYTPTWLVNSLILCQKRQKIKLILNVENLFNFSTTDIKFLWIRGKPSVIQAVFLITSESQSTKLKELFEHLNKTNKQVSFD